MLKEIRYLYVVDKSDWLNMVYIEAFKRKNELAVNLIGELLKVPYQKRDFTRIADIVKAIEYNNDRLKE